MNDACQKNLARAYSLTNTAHDKVEAMYDGDGRVVVFAVTLQSVSSALDDLNNASCALRAVKNQLLGNPETRSRA